MNDKKGLGKWQIVGLLVMIVVVFLALIKLVGPSVKETFATLFPPSVSVTIDEMFATSDLEFNQLKIIKVGLVYTKVEFNGQDFILEDFPNEVVINYNKGVVRYDGRMGFVETCLHCSAFRRDFKNGEFERKEYFAFDDYGEMTLVDQMLFLKSQNPNVWDNTPTNLVVWSHPEVFSIVSNVNTKEIAVVNKVYALAQNGSWASVDPGSSINWGTIDVQDLSRDKANIVISQ